MSSDMYQQNIMDHAKHPRNFGEIANASNKAHAANPLCGDKLDFYLVLNDQNQVADVKFSGSGCTITKASASMLSEKLYGMDKSAIEKLTTEDITTMLGVDINPARMKCATLSLETVQQAIGHH